MPENTQKKLFAAERALLKRQGRGLGHGSDMGSDRGLRPMAAPAGPSPEIIMLMAAIEELKEQVKESCAPPPPVMATPDSLPEMSVLKGQLQDLKDSIDRTKREIAAVRHPDAGTDDRLLGAALELDAIVTATEDATNEILNAAEDIDDRVHKLRQRGLDPEGIALLDDINGFTIKVLEACNFQDLSGQRTTKVIKTIHYLEERIGTMIDIWGAEEFRGVEVAVEEQDPDQALLQGPQSQGQGVSQGDIDSLFD